MNLACGLLEIGSLVVMFTIPAGHPVVITAMLLIYGYAITGPHELLLPLVAAALATGWPKSSTKKKT